MQGNGTPHQNDLPVLLKNAGMEIEPNWGK
jgi:hypothetical protein